MNYKLVGKTAFFVPLELEFFKTLAQACEIQRRENKKSLFWGTVDKIIFLFTCCAKYFAPCLAYYNEFDELIKAEKFYVTCGTYLDWQNRIFAALPEIDFFKLDANEETNFRPLRKKTFRKKILSGLDLRHGFFEECICWKKSPNKN